MEDVVEGVNADALLKGRRQPGPPPKAVIDGPNAPAGERYTKAEQMSALGTKKENPKIRMTVRVTRSDVLSAQFDDEEDEEEDRTHSLEVTLPPPGDRRPEVVFSGELWTGREVMTVMRELRRCFRRYQIGVRELCS